MAYFSRSWRARVRNSPIGLRFDFSGMYSVLRIAWLVSPTITLGWRRSMSKVSGHVGGRTLISDMQGWDSFKMLRNLLIHMKQRTHLETLSSTDSFILLASLPHLEVKKTIGALHSVDIKVQARIVRIILKYQLRRMLVGNQSDYLVA